MANASETDTAFALVCSALILVDPGSADRFGSTDRFFTREAHPELRQNDFSQDGQMIGGIPVGPRNNKQSYSFLKIPYFPM